jgi:hypothetical protein
MVVTLRRWLLHCVEDLDLHTGLMLVCTSATSKLSASFLKISILAIKKFSVTVAVLHVYIVFMII